MIMCICSCQHVHVVIMFIWRFMRVACLVLFVLFMHQTFVIWFYLHVHVHVHVYQVCMFMFMFLWHVFMFQPPPTTTWANLLLITQVEPDELQRETRCNANCVQFHSLVSCLVRPCGLIWEGLPRLSDFAPKKNSSHCAALAMYVAYKLRVWLGIIASLALCFLICVAA